jgi:predicted GNAT superfamily acetyltransferase
MPAPSRLAADAGLAAAEAARRAGVEVSDLREIDEHRRVAALFVEIWKTPLQDAPCTPQLLRALAHSGNYVAGARLDGQLVGAAAAFLHPDRDGLALHSHITGVSDAAQGRSVGFALKQHQRAWALARGIARINWTFDPLVRRNAWFNLVKLGAEGVEYLPHFYGPMADAINAGDETDRCLITWRLESGRAVAAAHGHTTDKGHEPWPSPPEPQTAGAVVLLAACPDGRPGPAAPADAPDPMDAPEPVDLADPAVRRVLAWVPPDVVALRASDAEVALQWRRALRTAMGTAMRRGFVATGMTRSGWYVLDRTPEEEAT